MLCELHLFTAGLLHCCPVISLSDISYVIWYLVLLETETQQEVM